VPFTCVCSYVLSKIVERVSIDTYPIIMVVQVTGNNRSTIIVPSSGLQQFRTLLDEFIE
jgi:hypothetical protein